jgi:hypothetical protein
MVMHPHTNYNFYTSWTYILYMPIFSRIFLSNNWWQKSDIWSQSSYRYPISWEAFLDPSDSYFLLIFIHIEHICSFFVAFFSATIWGTYMKLVTKYQISAINSYWEKCDEKDGRMDGQTDRGKTVYPPYRGKRFWTHQIPTSCWFLYTLNIYAHFSSHFSQQLLMAEI